MKKLLIVPILFSLFFLACSKNDTIVNSTKTTGSVSISLDKNTTPSNVVSVIATFTRENYQQITGYMNLLTDTTATLTMQQLAVGLWHVKVEAKDAQNNTIYVGETDVNILDGIVTQVSLTLLPTTQGVGGVRIVVKWGSTISYPSEWTDSPNSPVLIGTQNFESTGVAYPCILKEGNMYKMWYTGVNGGAIGYIGYAVSQDGINWTKNNLPVLSPSSGNFDNTAVAMSQVLKISNGYKMYYAGRSGNQVLIGAATSIDGISWNKNYGAVLTGNNYNEKLFPTSIIYLNDKFYLYYYSSNGISTSICLATSINGVTFVKENQPIITVSELWEGNALTSANVVYDNNKFKMYYLTSDGKYIGYAESGDGKNWVKNLQPIFTNNSLNNSSSILYSLLNIKSDSENRIYYTCLHSNYQIGFIKKNL
ncbi:MAG: hypothetical protein Q8903_02910 [Bacteroidota bacterium]|nr:hypothetical protein [Bacteroidota bacterium]